MLFRRLAFKKNSILLAATAVVATLGGAPRSVLAKPSFSLADEVEAIKEVVDLFSSFCNADTGACNDFAAGEATGRRDLLSDDTAIANRHLEAAVQKLSQHKLWKDNNRRGLLEQGHVNEEIYLCALETIGCHLYLDNLYLPPVEDYTYVDVCIARDGFKSQCEKDLGVKELQFVKSTDGIQPNEFLYQSTGPPQLQGVFALEYSDCSASTLVSWAKGRESPGGVNTGVFGDVVGDGTNFGVTGPLRTPFATDYVYAQRVLGDHSWAFGPNGFLGAALSLGFDLVYKTVLLEGTIANPKKMQIIPDVKIPFTCIRLEIKGCLENLVRFELTLVEDCMSIDTSAEGGLAAKAACDSGKSFVWARDSWFGGYEGDPDWTYYIIQVVDGTGKKISPAWDTFAQSQAEDCGNGKYTSNSFPSLGGGKGKGGADAGFCHCAYTGDRPYGLDNLEPFFGELDSKKRGRRARRRTSETGSSYNKKNSHKRGARSLAVNNGDIERHLQGSCPEYTPNPSVSPAPTRKPTRAPTPLPTKSKGKGRE